MSVLKDEKTGKYYVKYYYINKDGKLSSTTKRGFKTKRDAQLFDAEHKVDKDTALDIGNMPIEDFVEKYMKDKSVDLKESSLHNKRNVIDKHILNKNGLANCASFRGMKMKEITKTTLKDWQISKIEEKNPNGEPYSQTYLRTIRKELSALLNHAETYYELKGNPSSLIHRMGQSDAEDIEFWTIDEFNEFINAAKTTEPDMYVVLFYLLFYSGCRVGEILSLTAKDVDFSQGCIYILKTYHRQNKTDVKTSPKTDKSKRAVAIPQKVLQMISDYIECNPNIIDDNSRIFDVVHKTVQNHFNDVVDGTELKKITVHCLRHSHVALAINMKEDIYMISKRLGHQDIETTYNKYGHLYPERQEAFVSKLNDLI